MGIFSRRKGARSYKQKCERLAELLRHSRVQTREYVARFNKELYEISRRIAGEAREHVDSMEEMYGKLERLARSKIEGVNDLEEERDRLKVLYDSTQAELKDLRVGNGLVPFLGLLENFSPFDKVMAVCVNRDVRPIYVTNAFLSEFDLDKKNFEESRLYTSLALQDKLKKDENIGIEIDGKIRHYTLTPRGLCDTKGNFLGSYVQFHHRGLVGSIKDKVGGTTGIADKVQEIISGLDYSANPRLVS